MGFFDTLFGGTSREQIMTDDQMNLLNQLTRQVSGQVGRGGPVYEGQVSPDATQNQLAAFEGAAGLGGNAPGFVDPREAIRQLLSGEPAYQVDPAARERYYNEAVVGPAKNEFADTLRELDHRYGARFGTAGAQRAAGLRAADRFHTGLAGQRAQLVFGDEQARRQSLENALSRMAGGVGLTTESNRMGNLNRLANLGMQANLGGEERAIEGQQLGEQYNKWQMGQPAFNPWLGFANQVLSAQPYAAQSQPGILGTLMSGAGGMMSGIAGLMA